MGPVKRKRLLTHIGSLKKVELATEEEQKQVKGITESNILSLKEIFKGRNRMTLSAE